MVLKNSYMIIFHYKDLRIQLYLCNKDQTIYKIGCFGFHNGFAKYVAMCEIKNY